MARAIVIVDYQNIHLTAHGKFAPPGVPKHETLIHPLHFANQLMHARSLARQRVGRDSADDLPPDLAKVAVFRGLPGNKQQPDFYRRSQAQEKGVDVQVAIKVVKAIESGDDEFVILAAHDTDQEPALEFAVNSAAVVSGAVQIETGGWVNCKRLRVPGKSMWHTTLSARNFVDARDRKQYS